MQLTDWLVVVFVVAIIVVMLDGVRRKLQERRNRVVLKIDRNLPHEEFDEEKLASAELPNGGARTLPRTDQPAPTLRKLKSANNFNNPRASGSASGGDSANTVPVLMDAVELEEEHIEHTNVFADSGQSMSFEADAFDQEFDDDLDTSTDPRSRGREHDRDEDDWNDAADDRDHHDDAEGFDEDFEEDDEEVSPMLREEAVMRSTQTRGLDTRYQGRDDDDDYDDDEDDLAEEEFDDDDFDDELISPAELDEDDDEDDDEEDLDDLDDDFDDDEEADEDEDELEEDDEIDELGGYPEDDWGIEEEQDLLEDDYENEPVLLQDTYNKAASHFSRNTQHPRIEPGFGDDDGFDDGFDEGSLEEDFSAATTDEIEVDEDDTLAPLPGTRRSAPAPAPARSSAPAAAEDSTAPDDQTRRRHEQSELYQREKPVPASGTQTATAARQEPDDFDESGPQEVIIINVMARPGQMFKGSALLPVLQQQGLRLGDMSIFHRHADPQGNGPIVFSMANMVKPGTFDLSTMETFATPGVSLFLQMPNRIGNMAAFDMMLGTASALRNALGGELKDENRSVFTRQTVEHCRQRVSDFELALLSRK